METLTLANHKLLTSSRLESLKGQKSEPSSSSKQSLSYTTLPNTQKWLENVCKKQSESACIDAQSECEKLVHEVADLAAKRLQNIPSDKEKHKAYLRHHFVPLDQLEDKSLGALFRGVALHVQKSALEKLEQEKENWEQCGTMADTLQSQKRSCVPREQWEALKAVALLYDSPCSKGKRLPFATHQSSYIVDPKPQNVPDYKSIDDWVEAFNHNDGERDERLSQTHLILEDLRYQAWNWEGTTPTIPIAKKVPLIRKSLLKLVACDDQSVQIKALKYLIELLEADPLTEDSSHGIFELVNDIRDRIAIKVEGIEKVVQRPLMRAYALGLENILLHEQLENTAVISQVTKDLTWDRADEYKGYSSGDKEIDYWTGHALEAVKRCKTNISDLEDFARRFLLVTNSIVQIAATINSPDAAPGALETAQANLMEAFYHLPLHEAWFEKTILVRRLARFGMRDYQEFQEIAPCIQFEKGRIAKPHSLPQKVKKKAKDLFTGTNDELFLYGVVSTLGSTALYSPEEEVAKSAMKLLIQFGTTNNDVIQKKIVEVFSDIQERGGRLGETARLLIHFFPVLPDKCGDKTQKLIQKIQIQSPPLDYEEGADNSYYNDVLMYMVHYVAEVRSLEEPGGHSLVTVLANSEEKEVVKTFFQWIKDHAPHYQKPDVYGRTAYHVAMSKHNNSVIKDLAEELKGIDINALDHQKDSHHTKELKDKEDDKKPEEKAAQHQAGGYTALHEAVNYGFALGIPELVKFGAQVDKRSLSGLTPLHLAVTKDAYLSAEALLKEGADPNALNFDQECALDLVLEEDREVLLGLLLQYGADTGQSPYITPLMAAAHYGAENCLIRLIHARGSKAIEPDEALSILLYMSRGAAGKGCSQMFFQFYEERLKNDPKHGPVLKLFKDWPGLERVGNHYRVKRAQGKARALYGNTEFIELCRSTKEIATLKESIQGAKKSLKTQINKSNYFRLNPLHAAILNRNEKAISLLIKAGIDLNQKDAVGNTPLHYAAWLRDDVLMETLLKSGAKPNPVNIYGETPLLLFSGEDNRRIPSAIHTVADRVIKKPLDSKSLERIFKLAEHFNIDLLAKDRCGNTALHKALGTKQGPIAEALCLQAPELFWMKNSLGLTPFLDALRHGEVPHLAQIMQAASGEDLLALEKLFEQVQTTSTLVNKLIEAQAPIELIRALLMSQRKLAFKAAKDKRRETPLHVAARMGRLDILQLYNELEFSRGAVDSFDNTVAHTAAINKQEAFLKQLIQDSPQLLNKRNKDGRVPSHLAAVKCSTEMMKALTPSEKHCLIKDNHGETPLHLACRYGNKKAVEVLINKNPKTLFVGNRKGNTPLHLAAAAGQLECVKLLLAAWNEGRALEEKKAKEQNLPIDPRWTIPLYAVENARGEAPLALAAQECQLKTLCHLVDEGENFRSADFNQETGLHKATRNLHIEVIEKLLEMERVRTSPGQQKRIDARRDGRGEVAIHELLKIGERLKEEPDKAEKAMLIHLQANKKLMAIRNEHGLTFVHGAAARGMEPLLSYLAEHQQMAPYRKYVNWSAQDNRGNTPLHHAVKGNHASSVKLLLKQGVSLNTENENGETPLMLAMHHASPEIAKMLINQGAKVLVHDKKGKTIIHHLFKYQKPPLSEEMSLLLAKILKVFPELVHEKDDSKRTPLHVLAQAGHVNQLSIVLRALPPASQKELEAYVWKQTKSDTDAEELAPYHMKQLIRDFPSNELGAEGKKIPSLARRVFGNRKKRTRRITANRSA